MNVDLRTGLSLADVFFVPIFFGWYIWRGQSTEPLAWLGAVAWLLASFLIHRDTPKTLRMRADNLWPARIQAAIVYGVFALALFVIGMALGQQMHAPPNYRSFGRLWSYFAFCLVQQIALNSLLMNRLISLVKPRWLASLIAGAIFSALHWPNPVLVPLTLVAGTAMAWMFARERNILPLAF